MKKNLKAELKTLILAALASTLVFATGCKKDKDDPLPTQYGRVALLHAGFGGDSLNIFVDGQKVNQKPFGYTDTAGYFNLPAGTRKFELKGKDSKTLLAKSLSVEKNKNYSLFASNGKDAKTFELIPIEDALSAPADNKAKIRFVHLSPDTDKLHFVAADDSKISENIGFKNAGAFKELDAKKTSFKVIDADKKTVIGEVKDLQLEKGKLYTIWLTGLKAELKTNVFVNK